MPLDLFAANRPVRCIRGFGGYEDAMPVGPQFQISWKADKEVHFEGTPGFQGEEPKKILLWTSAAPGVILGDLKGEEPTNKFLLSNEQKGAF